MNNSERAVVKDCPSEMTHCQFPSRREHNEPAQGVITSHVDLEDVEVAKW